MKKQIEFLTLVETMQIHHDQIARYGGICGWRDIRLLESAMAMPSQTFDRCYLHKNLFEMAAAYAYHISENQPFLDGNKRVGLASALVFLDLNGIRLDDPENKLLSAMQQLSNGKMNKRQFAEILKKLK